MTKKSSTRSIAIWTAVALVGAVCWGIVALVRGEQISAVWLLGAAVGSYAIAFRFYGRFIANKVLEVDDKRATPAEQLDNQRYNVAVPESAFRFDEPKKKGRA